MEKIKKIINIEPFKTRFSGMKIPVCNSSIVRNVKWGEIPKDLVIDNEFVRYEKTFPLVRDILNKPILRFRRAIEIFLFLKKFVNQSQFYALCKRKEGLRWVIYDEEVLSCNESISEIKGVFEDLPNTEGFSLGNIIWVGKGAVDFIKMFQKEDDTLYIAISYAKSFANYLLNVFYGEQLIGNTTPYVPLPILITQDYDDMGLMSPATNEWIPNKKYYLGESVIYEEESYRLISAPLVDADGKRYYKGNFVEADKIIYFDDIENGKIVLNHWEKISNNFTNIGRINGYAESRLRSLIRYKRDFDDDGNELPFVIKYLESGEMKADLLYVIGLKFNVKTIEDIMLCDCITDINEDIDNEEITFTYYIGAKINEDDSIDEDSGVKYIETYPYIKKIWSGYYEKKLISVEYTDIEYVNQIWDSALDTEGDKIYAKVEYPVSSDEDFIAVPYIKRDSLLGIQDYTSNIENIKISRGKAAAFELHNILGEIHTFEDLETYRNDFFNVKSNEIM